MSKDSVYTAVGLAAPVLHQSLDFNAFLDSHLALEIQKQYRGCYLLRRRICILIAHWIFKIDKSNRSTVYRIFQHLLDKDVESNHLIIRITAGKKFYDVANEMEFEPRQFEPFASTILTRLMALIEEVALTDTKMSLLNTVSIIVERLDEKVRQFNRRVTMSQLNSVL